jgi:hypothetical protein
MIEHATYYHLLSDTQMLAAKLPSRGLNPYKLALLPLDDLIGVLAFLKWFYAEKVL